MVAQSAPNHSIRDLIQSLPGLPKDPTHLTADQLSTVVVLTEKALTKQILCGEALLNLSSFPDLPPTVTRSELSALRGRNEPLPPSLNNAHALTIARLSAPVLKPVVLFPHDSKK